MNMNPLAPQPLGSAPDARAYFFLSCQEKVAKKKSRPLRRPAIAGSSALLSRNGGCGTRGYAPQTVLALFPLRLALLDDAEGLRKTIPLSTVRGIRFRSVCFVPPSCSAEQRRRAGGSRRGLSEGQSPEFRSRPAARVAQGSRRSRPRNAGVAFSLASFFWRPKRKNARASGAENSLSLLHHTYRSQSPSHARSNPQPADCLPARHDAACRLVENKGNPYA